MKKYMLNSKIEDNHSRNQSFLSVSLFRTVLSVLLINFTFLMPSWAALPFALASGEKIPSLAPMLKGVLPSVVSITTYSKVKQQRQRHPLLDDPMFRRYFQVPENKQNPERRAQGAGSGVIVNATEGYLLTNAHVVENADEIKVTLKDGRILDAELVGTDKQADIAVLKVDAENLVDITIADSDQLEVGDFVLAIGNPFGLGQTVTSGIVGALGRTNLGIHGYENFIQTDASINPGNSGGALVNLRGELVGINSAIIAPSGGNVGIGFAIPTNMASSIMMQLIEYGEVRRGLLGVLIQDLTPELAEAFELGDQKGVLIAQVVDGGAADLAGIKPDDVVLRIDGEPIEKVSELRNKIGLTEIGSRVEVQVLRDGKKKKFTAKIQGNKKEELKGKRLSQFLGGVEVKVKDDEGIKVVGIDSSSMAFRSGLREGDVIVSANKRLLTSLDELRVAAKLNKRQLLLRIIRNGGAFYIVVR